ncbi:hypothetical protein RRG08_018188 [Elysia crispata]|uniref:Uncharacterized protein n=1 Tax=Elysia crispata TaxID=231223 RepID=A0AAE1DP73_9GAST|nr:hypothetical protein RRG08_018188 [Elysia crispata]
MNSRRAPSKRIWEAFAFGLSGIKTEPTPPSLPRVIFLRSTADLVSTAFDHTADVQETGYRIQSVFFTQNNNQNSRSSQGALSDRLADDLRPNRT